MRRHALTDQHWLQLQAVLPAHKGRKSNISDRDFIDAVLFRAKTGIPWRDLPERFGPWHNVYNRFSRWSRRGVWKRVYKALRVRVDKTGSIVDGSNVRAHQDAAGGKGGSNEIVWVVAEVDSPPKSTSSPTAKDARCM
jgi:transposase